MDRISVISDSVERAENISRQLAGIFSTKSFAREGFSHAAPPKYVIVDIDLEENLRLVDLRLWLELRPSHGKAIFVVEHGVRLQAVQAFALGATDLVVRPVDRKSLLAALLGDISFLAGNPVNLSMGDRMGYPQGSERCKASSPRRSAEFQLT